MAALLSRRLFDVAENRLCEVRWSAGRDAFIKQDDNRLDMTRATPTHPP